LRTSRVPGIQIRSEQPDLDRRLDRGTVLELAQGDLGARDPRQVSADALEHRVGRCLLVPIEQDEHVGDGG
jgi:hypothetical protein